MTTENVDTLLEQLLEVKDKLNEQLDNDIREAKKKRTELEELEMFSNYDFESLQAFKKKPYHILPRKKDEYYFIVPKFVNISVGYLLDSTPSFNVFVINKFAKYLGSVPKAFDKIFKFKTPLPLKMFDGMLLTGEEHQDTAWQRYKHHLTKRKGTDRIQVKKGHEFDLTAQIIDDGVLPFIANPIDPKYIVKSVWHLDKIEEEKDRLNIENRLSMQFFKDAVKRLLATGAIGVYWTMGVGKTLLGLMLLSMIKVDDRPNVIVAGSSLMIKTQWEKALELITPAAPVIIVNYQSIQKILNMKIGLIIFDEAHRLPAKTYKRGSFVDAYCRLGLSGTPQREDGLTNLIFALTGEPVGLDWRVPIELGLIKEPDIILFLCDSYAQKRAKLAELLRFPKKTLIYSYSLPIGKSLSAQFEIPFVHGATRVKDRLDILKSSLTSIVSSVGAEGISIRDLDRTITYSFHFGGRQEEEQFFGRLLHGESKGLHILMMTYEEEEKYGKRILSIEEKFTVQRERIGGGSYTSPSTKARKRTSAPRSHTTRNIPTPKPKPQPKTVDTSQFPFLDERDPFDEKHAEEIIFTILRSDYAKMLNGCTLADIRIVLDKWHIKYKKRYVESVVVKLYDTRKLAAKREGSKRRYFAKEGGK